MYVIPGYHILGPESLVTSSANSAIEVWDSATEYFVGDLVYGADESTVYECAVGPARFLAGQYCGQEHGVDMPNVGNDPEAEEPPTVPAMDRSAYPDYVDIDDCFVESGKLWWIKRGEYWENEYRMFMESPDLVTVGSEGGTSTLAVTMTHTQPFQAVALIRVKATQAAFSSGGVTQTIDLSYSNAESLPGARTRDNAIFLLPSVIPANQTFTVTLTMDNSIHAAVESNPFQASCGFVYAGFPVEIGMTYYGTSIGIIDYSRKERDAFGRAIILERSFTNKVTYKISVETDRIYQTSRFLASIRSKLSVYIGKFEMPETIVAGYFKDFSIPVESFSDSVFDLTVEGL
jgi:hypothetical protein